MEIYFFPAKYKNNFKIKLSRYWYGYFSFFIQRLKSNYYFDPGRFDIFYSTLFFKRPIKAGNIKYLKQK